MLTNKAFLFSLALLAAYLLLGWFVAPRLLQPRLEQYVASELGRELRFESLRVDPLTWTVRLNAVDLAAGEQSVWPGLSISAREIDLRFSFWRLSAVVAALTMHEPRFVQSGTPAQSQAPRYPFVGLWQQLQEGLRTAGGQQSVPVRNWRIDAGQVLRSKDGSPATADVELDGIYLRAGPQNQDGLREYSLDFAIEGTADIGSRGLYKPADLTATGQYELAIAPAPNGSMAELQASGTFSAAFLADALRIDLSESQLLSSRVATCMHDGLLCAAIMPLQAGFDSSLLVTSDRIRVLEANGRLSAFQLDASLGQGRVELAEQRDFDGARIELGLPPAVLADTAAEQGVRHFDIQLNAANDDQYQVEGQLNQVSQAVDARVQINGRQALFGSVQLRSLAAQQAQSAHSRLELQLENPAASVAQEFMSQHLTAVPEFRTLQLQLAATLDEAGLNLQGNIALAPSDLTANAEADSGPVSTAGSGAALDAEWLMALLQDSDDRIQFAIPELAVDSAPDTSLGAALEQQVLSMLAELAEQPFVGLAKAFAIGNQNLNELSFAPGSAALDGASTEKLADLASILVRRPGLGIAVTGAYDPVLDKKALQTEQVRTHIALATAADLAFRTGAEPPDFNDPIVHSVIDEFARRRVPPDVMQEFAEQYGHADADQGVLPEGDAVTYYSSLFELLVYYAEIPQGALTTLARYRAQAVTDALADAGVLRERLNTAAQASVSEAGAGGVPVGLQMEVWLAENGASRVGSAERIFAESQPATLAAAMFPNLP